MRAISVIMRAIPGRFGANYEMLQWANIVGVSHFKKGQEGLSGPLPLKIRGHFSKRGANGPLARFQIIPVTRVGILTQ